MVTNNRKTCLVLPIGCLKFRRVRQMRIIHFCYNKTPSGTLVFILVSNEIFQGGGEERTNKKLKTLLTRNQSKILTLLDYAYA